MTVAYEGHCVTVHIADALDVLAGMADASVDAVVTDPPYGLEFMGKEWDSFRPDVIVNRGGGVPGRAAWDSTKMAPVEYGGAKQRSTLVCDGCGKSDKFRNAHDCPDGTGWTRRNLDTSVARVAYAKAFQDWCEAWATECLRVLKPGGHLLAFGGTRTWHRLACAVEDAGFEVRDSIAWLHGQGFPKSLDVSKAIDKAAGALAHESVGFTVAGRTDKNLPNPVVKGYTPPAPATPDAERWQGWGTALKPAFEPVVVARKPLVGTVAATVLAHGTGALNIDGCRVEGPKPDTTRGASVNASSMAAPLGGQGRILDDGKGRWPANVVLDESQAEALDEQSGERPGFSTQRDLTARTGTDGTTTYGAGVGRLDPGVREGFNDTGGASRFFYVAKADASERPRVNGTAHPTVKPLDLMRWLVRLVTPPGGTVLEPFAGSGTTVEACIVEGFQCIAIEREADYLPLIRQRIDRQRDPVEAIRQRGEDLGLFDHLEGAP